MIQYFCDKCGMEICQPSTRYTLNLELFAARENLFFTEADLKKDHRAEMDELIRQMEKMDSDELNDEVYVKYEFDLCGSCRKQIYWQFQRELPLNFEKWEKSTLLKGVN